jgi:hypothetical protein
MQLMPTVMLVRRPFDVPTLTLGLQVAPPTSNVTASITALTALLMPSQIPRTVTDRGIEALTFARRRVVSPQK